MTTYYTQGRARVTLSDSKPYSLRLEWLPSASDNKRQNPAQIFYAGIPGTENKLLARIQLIRMARIACEHNPNADGLLRAIKAAEDTEVYTP